MYEQPLTMTFILGLPGSGKSTFVERHVQSLHGLYTVISFDTLRQSFGHVYHRSTEPHVNALACNMARVAFMSGQSVCIDESITVPGLAMELVNIGREFKARTHMMHLTTPVDRCRSKRVPDFMTESEFERKLSEWQTWGKYILSLADNVEHVHFEPSYNTSESAGLACSSFVGWGPLCQDK